MTTFSRESAEISLGTPSAADFSVSHLKQF
jgi:hypothetical protein